MNRPTRKIMRYSWVGWLNILILQWFFVRLGYTDKNPLVPTWVILRWIVPLTGWWELDFKYLTDKKEKFL